MILLRPRTAQNCPFFDRLRQYCWHPGISARARKAELERLNEQLRKINMSLRQQARAGTVYAPGLNYAPLPLPPPTSKRSDDNPVAELTDTAIQLINGVKVTPGSPAAVVCKLRPARPFIPETY